MRDIYFIVTKPLQLIIATAILKQLKCERNFILCVVDGFYGSKDVALRISGVDLGWDDVFWFPEKKSAIKFCISKKPKSIFIDSDVGFYNFILLTIAKVLTLRTLIYVYEEGVGSYRDDLYSGFKKKVLDFFGIATSFGNSLPVSGIWLYETERYCKKHVKYNKKCHAIREKVSDLIKNNMEDFSCVFGCDNFFKKLKKHREICNIYFSSWDVDLKIIDNISKKDGDFYIKLHPHIKENEFDCSGFFIIKNNIPAEIVIIRLSEIYSEVNAYHHGSSLVNYLPNIKNFSEKNI